MSKFVVRFLAVVLGLFVAAHLIEGVTISGIYSAIIVAVFLGLMNVLVRPVLVILTLPITIATLGLFLFVINALIFLFIGTIVKGFDVEGFIPALFGTLIVSTISWFIQKIT